VLESSLLFGARRKENVSRGAMRRAGGAAPDYISSVPRESVQWYQLELTSGSAQNLLVKLYGSQIILHEL
jgi:hypothetical protein